MGIGEEWLPADGRHPVDSDRARLEWRFDSSDYKEFAPENRPEGIMLAISPQGLNKRYTRASASTIASASVFSVSTWASICFAALASSILRIDSMTR